jgi:hypothetical protein
VPKLATAAGSRLQVRVGIATGLVVVGDLIGAGASQEQTVVGETADWLSRFVQKSRFFVMLQRLAAGSPSVTERHRASPGHVAEMMWARKMS